jgi:hypothetical protein
VTGTWERPVPPTATATADCPLIRLSDTLSVTLIADGSTPLRVELPKELLADESALVWKIEPVGAAEVRELAPGSGRWQQSFRLSPFLNGDPLPLTFNPIRVNGVEVPVNPLMVKVETSIRSPTAADARPVTDIEPLPPPTPTGFSPGFYLPVLCAAVFIAAVAVVLLRRRRKPVPLTSHEWANRRLTELEATPLPATSVIDGIVDVIRGYLARRFQLTVDPLTTVELLRTADAAGVWDADTRAAVGSILEACDGVKYSGRTPGPEQCRDWCERTRAAVNGWTTPPPISPA